MPSPMLPQQKINFKKWLRKKYIYKKSFKTPIWKIDDAYCKEDIQVDDKIQNIESK